jgi:glycosyltransferase involved in cell wall biosynthesis
MMQNGNAASRPREIFVYPVSPGSKYVHLTFRGIEDRFIARIGRDDIMAEALAKAGPGAILHIQWEEFLFSHCASAADADRHAETFREQLTRFVTMGGKVVLTIHNGVPHSIPFVPAFLAARQIAVNAATRIIAHNLETLAAVAAQVTVDAAKFAIMPHPSSWNIYEDSEALVETARGESNRDILAFGTVRRQKGLDFALDALQPSFLTENGLRIRVSGRQPKNEDVLSLVAQRPDIFLQSHYIDDIKSMQILRKSLCCILPYRHFLTSGIAHLILTAGGLYVGARVSQHLDLLPEINHRFLYTAGDQKDFRRAILDISRLTAEDRKSCVMANLEKAKDLRPGNVSKLLAEIYEKL